MGGRYFTLEVRPDGLRLEFIGNFEDITDAIETHDSKRNESIWVLGEDDVRLLMEDAENLNIKS